MNPQEIEYQELVKTQEKQTEIKEEKLDRLIEAGALSVLSIEKGSHIGPLYSPICPVQQLTKLIECYNSNVPISRHP